MTRFAWALAAWITQFVAVPIAGVIGWTATRIGLRFSVQFTIWYAQGKSVSRVQWKWNPRLIADKFTIEDT